MTIKTLIDCAREWYNNSLVSAYKKSEKYELLKLSYQNITKNRNCHFSKMDLKSYGTKSSKAFLCQSTFPAS